MWQGWYEFVVNQWGVGHGGFHSQSLQFQEVSRNPTAPVGDGSLVRAIYDCGCGRGSRPGPALTNAVSRMLGDVPDGSTIDLLVVSHFDRDHVNGLAHLSGELVRKRIRVARVWSPVLTKVEALLAVATSGFTGVALQRYAALVADPVGQLAALFDGATVTQFEPTTEPIPLIPGGAGASDDDAGGDIVLIAAPDGRGIVARSGGAPTSEALWEFQPYVIQSTLAGASHVSARLEKILGKPVVECVDTDLITIAADKALLAKFHSAVRQHHMRDRKENRASSARTGANLSSLCVYSGPVSPYDWCHFRRGWDPIDVTRYAIPIAPAWLGTGDAGLLEVQHVEAMRTTLTQSRFDRVGISSAPHHGSRHDSSATLWDALPNARRVTIEANNTTAGTGNSHPHKSVLTELAARRLAVHTPAGADFQYKDKRIR